MNDKPKMGYHVGQTENEYIEGIVTSIGDIPLNIAERGV